jgi:tetratricopeptide (TPR) repeat protein
VPAQAHGPVQSSSLAIGDLTSLLTHRPSHGLSQSVSLWLAAKGPSEEDVILLRSALAEFYGRNRDIIKAEKLLTDAIARWEEQPSDERAGLYRVRGDCYMLLGDATKALEDYGEVIKLLDGPGCEKADASEIPGALLGRARSLKSLGRSLTPSEAKGAASDYKRALMMSARDEWDNEEEMIEDGASRNPYAAWEWGSVLRLTGDWEQASKVHSLAARAFEDVGDKARSSIAAVDSAIDLAATERVDVASSALRNAIERTKFVESSDVSLLERVLAKEGEAQIALASILWSDGQSGEAERLLEDACAHMGQLQMGSFRRISRPEEAIDEGGLHILKFSIDDGIAPTLYSCSKFKDGNFVTQLGWPIGLQAKLNKLQSLQ